MKRYVLWSMLAVAAIGLVLLPSVAAAAEDVPFTETYVLTATEVHGNRTFLSGTGTGTVVGAFLRTGWVQIKRNQLVGASTITAANGDSLYIESTQTWDRPTQSWSGPFTIVGGTGRFANATGSGTTTNTPNPDGTTTGTREGKISF